MYQTMPWCLCSFQQLPSLSLSILTFIAAQENKPVQGKAGATGELAQVLVQDHTVSHACPHTGEQASPFPSWAKCPGCQQEEWLKGVASDQTWRGRWETYRMHINIGFILQSCWQLRGASESSDKLCATC